MIHSPFLDSQIRFAHIEIPTSDLKSRRGVSRKAGREAADRCLGGLGFPGFEIKTSVNKAPSWPPGISGSISHSGNWAVACAAKRDFYPCLGLDIQVLRQISNRAIRRISNSEERAWILGQPDPVFAGLMMFSLKEAIFKCLSSVLAPPLELKRIQPWGDRKLGEDIRCSDLIAVEINPTLNTAHGDSLEADLGTGLGTSLGLNAKATIIQDRAGVTPAYILSAAWLKPAGF